MRFTKLAIDTLKPSEKNRIVFDDSMPGFGVRIAPSGRKTFVLQYRVAGRTRRLSLGQYGTLSLGQAKRLAQAKLAEVSQGGDPSADRKRDRALPTLAEVCERFFEEHAKSRCKLSTQKEYRRCIDLFIVPASGNHKIHHVTRTHIADLHYQYRHIPYQANRTLGVLSVIFNHCEVWGLRPDGSNPCRHVKKYTEERRERFLSQRELARLGETLSKAESDGTETPFVVAAFRLLILTGCRLGEIQKLKWREIRLNDGLLLLEDSKTGAKPVYLGQAACDILRHVPRDKNNSFVIQGALPGQYVTDLQKPWRRLRKAAGLEDVRIHDLRHSHASFAVAAGESLPMIGKLLGHSQVATTARYAHLADDAVKAAAANIDSIVGRLLCV